MKTNIISNRLKILHGFFSSYPLGLREMFQKRKKIKLAHNAESKFIPNLAAVRSCLPQESLLRK